jgi:hypothetical protein
LLLIGFLSGVARLLSHSLPPSIDGACPMPVLTFSLSQPILQPIG